jgi:hypothetical protein
MAGINESTITLKIEGDGWVAQHSGPVADSVRALFGTAVLPTPFLRAAPRSLVRDTIIRLNPGVAVTFA